MKNTLELYYPFAKLWLYNTRSQDTKAVIERRLHQLMQGVE